MAAIWVQARPGDLQSSVQNENVGHTVQQLLSVSRRRQRVPPELRALEPEDLRVASPGGVGLLTAWRLVQEPESIPGQSQEETVTFGDRTLEVT